MIEPQILYGVTCDRCGETLINSNDNSAWYDRSTAEEEASEEDWHSVNGMCLPLSNLPSRMPRCECVRKRLKRIAANVHAMKRGPAH